MTLQVRMFSFYQTITILKTLHQDSLEWYKNKSADEIYKAGQAYYLKEGGKQGINHYFVHDAECICAVVTYQNNPQFIAGYVSKVLNQDLSLFHTIANDKLGIATAVYHVEGLDAPFFITYINAVDEQYKEISKALFKNKKNDMLKFLMSYIQQNYHNNHNPFDFYYYTADHDDFMWAKKLPALNRAIVERYTHEFIVTHMQESDKNLQAKLKPQSALLL